jgi:hypothetical protein
LLKYALSLLRLVDYLLHVPLGLDAVVRRRFSRSLVDERRSIAVCGFYT